MTALAGLYNRRGDFDRTIATLEESAALDPSDPSGYQTIATFYWEKAQKDTQLAPAQRWTYIFEGINAADRALAIKPDYVEALTYKSILLRMRAGMETDPVQQKATVAEADGLRARALELNKARAGVASGPTMISSTGPVPAPPPPSPSTGLQAPVRVGGGIRPPQKLRHVPPVYPLEAQQAKISGVVIIEATIGPDGLVYEAKVLKSIPLLDQAAVDSVRQWQFEPTLLNGAPVPVIMTVTVNFALM
jgi:TonB family protein